MNNYKVLDCTLWDGEYINKWYFGYTSIQNIYNNLINSKVDHIEAGFLKDVEYNKNRTLFDSFKRLEALLKINTSKLCVMIMSGEFDISKIPPKTEEINVDCIRYVFKKEQIKKAFDEIKQIQDLGYTISINPSNVDMYIVRQDKLNKK